MFKSSCTTVSWEQFQRGISTFLLSGQMCIIIVISVKNARIDPVTWTFNRNRQNHIISRISQGHSLHQVLRFGSFVSELFCRQTDELTERRGQTYYRRSPTLYGIARVREYRAILARFLRDPILVGKVPSREIGEKGASHRSQISNTSESYPTDERLWIYYKVILTVGSEISRRTTRQCVRLLNSCIAGFLGHSSMPQ